MIGSIVIRVEQEAMYSIPRGSCPMDVEIFRDGSVDFPDYDLNHERAAVEFGYPKSPQLHLYDLISARESYHPLGFILAINVVPIQILLRLSVDSFGHLLDTVSHIDIGMDKPYRSVLPAIVSIVTDTESTRKSRIYALQQYPVTSHSVKQLVDRNIYKMIHSKDPEVLSRDIVSFGIYAHDTLYRLDRAYHALTWFIIDGISDARNTLFSMCVTASLAAQVYHVMHPDDPYPGFGQEQEKLWQLGRLMDYLGGGVP